METTECNRQVRSMFERIAEMGIDISDAVYQLFLEAAPAARESMSTVDTRMRGRMLQQVMTLLMADADEGYLAFETGMHRSYGADQDLYRVLFVSVKNASKEVLGDQWQVADEVAINETIQRLLADIKRLNLSETS